MIVIATLILAGVAIFTAIRLYQLRQQAVAPTAPESKPEAAASKILKCEPITIKIPGTPGPSPTPEAPTCIGIKAFDKTWKRLTKADLSKLKAGNTVRLTVEGSSSAPDTSTPGILFSVARFRFQGSTAWTSTTLKKPNTNIFYFDYILPKNVTNFAIKAQGGYGPLTREKWVACTDLTFSLGVIPTPAGCNKSCNESVNPQITCEEGLICRSPSGGITGASGVCRNPDCPDRADCICPTTIPTPTPTEGPGEPNDCGGTCGSNSNCKSSLFCFEGICRNPSCSAEEDCTCAAGGTPTPTSKTIAGGGGTRTAAPTLEPTLPSEEIPAEPTAEPSLPEAGISFPTIIGTGVGILLLIGALLLAL